MEDCGTDFAAMLRDGQVGPETYDRFVAELLRAYNTSVGEGPDSDNHVDSQVSAAQGLYDSFFQAQFGSPELDKAMNELRSCLPRQIKRFCFSSWDFMPGNIFMGDVGIKFVDPTECVTGVPIIDLACLSGALGDVYHHPDAQLWYEGFKSLSLGPVAQLLDLDRKEAEQIYLLGRVVQTLLNLRAVLQQSGDPDIFVARIKRYTNQLFF